MTVLWPYLEDAINLKGKDIYKIDAGDAQRQMETAREILRRLKSQPGVVLSDEVGMGKTYVALAVAASVAAAHLASGVARPVVIMVPRGLYAKWPREWDQFKSRCVTSSGALQWVRTATARNPTAFFKLLDNSKESWPHIIFIAHGCFSRRLTDPWVKLALVRLARRHTKLSQEQMRRLYRWAPDIFGPWSAKITPDLIEELMQRDILDWKSLLVERGILVEDDDDPIPEGLAHIGPGRPLSELAHLLRDGTLPGRQGLPTRALTYASRAFDEACKKVYRHWLKRVQWHSPLLILDEAHHAKNDTTRLARLFRPESEDDVALFSGKFDRMLFLTATPFQLGHGELMHVLSSFSAVRFAGPTAPADSRDDFNKRLTHLTAKLDANQGAARQLDRIWGKLTVEWLKDRFPDDTTDDGWWAKLTSRPKDPWEAELVRSVEKVRRAKNEAEDELRLWVIRHNRPRFIEHSSGLIPRREYLSGAGITEPAKSEFPAGLPVILDEALPFLLAARAQGELARSVSRARALFAEGLCSSYEAFHDTRRQPEQARDELEDDTVPLEDFGEATNWYIEQIYRLIPSRRAPEAARLAHPKVRPVIERTLKLWLAGEKVLIFCFYRQTALALRDLLREQVEAKANQVVAETNGISAAQARVWLARISRRLGRRDSPYTLALNQWLRDVFAEREFSPLRKHRDELISLLAAYIRSVSFIARYMMMDRNLVAALNDDKARGRKLDKGLEAFRTALDTQADQSNQTLTQRVREFLRFALELHDRGRVMPAVDENGGDGSAIRPLDEYLAAVATYVAPRRRSDDDDPDASRQVRTSGGSYRAPAVVRMVYGDTKSEVRDRLMLAFNSPLFPEILVSSSVMAEGVDLHRFCRHVIHHDLCWNPSLLEQRTGRVDRIRAKAEICKQPIVVYEPYIGGSADERMYRVVKDRENWFQVVMGQKFDFSEATAEALVQRVPLPASLVRDLAFDLRVYRDNETVFSPPRLPPTLVD